MATRKRDLSDYQEARANLRAALDVLGEAKRKARTICGAPTREAVRAAQAPCAAAVRAAKTPCARAKKASRKARSVVAVRKGAVEARRTERHHAAALRSKRQRERDEDRFHNIDGSAGGTYNPDQAILTYAAKTRMPALKRMVRDAKKRGRKLEPHEALLHYVEEHRGELEFEMSANVDREAAAYQLAQADDEIPFLPHQTNRTPQRRIVSHFARSILAIERASSASSVSPCNSGKCVGA